MVALNAKNMKTKNAENLENATPPIKPTSTSLTSTLLFAVVFTALAALAFTVALAALTSQAEAKLTCGEKCPDECTMRGLTCFSKNVTEQVTGKKLVCRRQINTGCSLYLAWPVVQCNPGVPGYVQDPEIDEECDCGPLGLYALFGGGTNLFHKDITTECSGSASCGPLKRVGSVINCTLSETVERKCCDITLGKIGEGCSATEDCEAGLECRENKCKCPEDKEPFGSECKPKCSENEMRDTATGGCVPKCSDKEERVGSECVPKCSDKEERVGSECLPKCGLNFYRRGRECVKTPGVKLEGLRLDPYGTAENPAIGYIVKRPVIIRATPEPLTANLSEYPLQWELINSTAGNLTVKDSSAGLASAELVAIKEGLIGVKATAGNISTVTWLFIELLPLAKLIISPTDPVMPEGKVLTFVATGITTDNDTIPVFANWSVSPAGGRGEINPLTGYFKAIKKGLVFVNATARGSNSTLVSAGTTVNITESDIASLEIIPNVKTLYYPENLSESVECVVYTVVANNTKGESMSISEIPSIKWSLLAGSTFNPATLTELSNTMVSVCPLSEGNVTIVAYVEVKSNVTASLPIHITRKPATRNWSSFTIKLPPGAAAPGVEAGKSIQVYAEALDQNYAKYPIQNITWNINPQANGTITQDDIHKEYATVRGVKLGVIQINVSAESAVNASEKKSASAQVNIIPSKITRIEISLQQNTLKMGETTLLSIKGYGAVNESAEVNGKVHWNSSNTQRGTVGLSSTEGPPHWNTFTAGSNVGEVTVTASFDGPPKSSDSVSITILPPNIESVNVYPENVNIPVGLLLHFWADASKNCTSCLKGKLVFQDVNFTWTSSNTSVVDLATGAPTYASETSFFMKGIGEAAVYANITSIPIWGQATVTVVPAGRCTSGLKLRPPLESGTPFPSSYTESPFETYISIGGVCKVASFWECKPGTVMSENILFDTTLPCPQPNCPPTNVERLINRLTPYEKNVTIGGENGIMISWDFKNYTISIKEKDKFWDAGSATVVPVNTTKEIGFGVKVTAHDPVQTQPYKANFTIHYVC